MNFQKSSNLQQQQSRIDMPVSNANMQPKQRQHDMIHASEHREPLPITKNQAREPQRDNWYRDDWFSRQDNTWQQGAQRSSGGIYGGAGTGQYAGDYRNRRRSPSPERGWEVDLGGGGGYYRYA